MPAHTDLSGHTIRGIRVLRVAAIHPTRREYSYQCLCHCGKHFIATVSTLRNPRVKGCGCGQETLKHGRVRTAEYGIWNAMKSRCLNPTNHAYKDYGGRGISLCERWLDFKLFFADMGERPSITHSIDRVDNSAGYSKDNCRWATKREQALNTRRSKTPRTCAHCGASFMYTTKKQFLCSYSCGGQWRAIKAKDRSQFRLSCMS